ncbi:hypothetical protein A5627_23305 [Mycobacterium colombiense]|nr:hypothetical protein A5627_23305 [Mycobacterium colombiense]
MEFASAGPLPDDSTRGAHPVATISAPVLDADDRIALVLAIHPLRHDDSRDPDCREATAA